MSSSNQTLPISVSAISQSPLAFFEATSTLETRARSWHLDVMDGHFVPRLGLYPEFIREIADRSELPITVHLMAQRPEPFIGDLVRSGATRICFHVESTQHPHRIAELIKAQGVEVGVALNPGTSLSVLDHLTEGLSSITLMAINPGIVGHEFIPSTMAKISQLRRYLFENTTNTVPEIEVDGGVTFANALQIIQAGADSLVCGAGTVFAKGRPLSENLNRLEAVLENN